MQRSVSIIFDLSFIRVTSKEKNMIMHGGAKEKIPVNGTEFYTENIDKNAHAVAAVVECVSARCV